MTVPSSEVMSPEVERVRIITAWGIFSLNLKDNSIRLNEIILLTGMTRQVSMKVQKAVNLAPPISKVHDGGSDT